MDPIAGQTVTENKKQELQKQTKISIKSSDLKMKTLVYLYIAY